MTDDDYVPDYSHRNPRPLVTAVEAELRAEDAETKLRSLQSWAEGARTDLAGMEAALARAEVAERECADLHDALDKARGLIDDALASVRRRDQVAGWAQAAAVVEAASQ